MARRGENIHKRRDGRWEGRYIKARTPDRRICWGYIYGTTYAEVKQRLIHKKSEYGGFQLTDAHLTFTELAEAWLQSVKCGLKESTCAHYQYTLYKYVLPILGTVPISRLEENILEQALQKIIAPPDGQHKELGFSSARECLSMVRRICKYAVHLRLIRPMELSVRLPQEKSHSMTPLSVVEQNRLRTYVLSNPTPRKLGLLLGIESGLRIGEVCGLKWNDFDLKTGTVQIKRAVSRIPCGDGHTKIVIQTPKTRTSRREIPLSKHMVQALKILQKSYPSDAWFLSGNTIKPVEPRCYRKSIKTYLKQAAVHQVRPHVLRHPYVKHTTKIFSLRLMDFQAQAYPDARRKTRGACQLLRVGQSRSPVRPLYNRKRFSCLPPQSKMSWILYAISMRLSGYTSTRSISISASSVVSASASKIALDASFRLSCRACSSCFCFACANTAA